MLIQQNPNAVTLARLDAAIKSVGMWYTTDRVPGREPKGYICRDASGCGYGVTVATIEQGNRIGNSLILDVQYEANIECALQAATAAEKAGFTVELHLNYAAGEKTGDAIARHTLRPPTQTPSDAPPPANPPQSP